MFSSKVPCVVFHKDSESGLGIDIGQQQPKCRRTPKFSLRANPAVRENTHFEAKSITSGRGLKDDYNELWVNITVKATTNATTYYVSNEKKARGLDKT